MPPGVFADDVDLRRSGGGANYAPPVPSGGASRA
jgi:hypothetical protein